MASSISKEFMAFRTQNLLTQGDMGTALGCSRRTVWNVENGMHAPTKTTLRKFRDLKQKYKESKVEDE